MEVPHLQILHTTTTTTTTTPPPSPPHPFSPQDLRVLSAISDTFVPSLPPNHLAPNDDPVSIFHSLSASQADILSEVAGQLHAYLRPLHMRSVRLVLRLLSTKLGTLLLGGWSSFTRKFPFIHEFRSLPLRNREKILLNWSLGFSLAFQQAFKVFKCYILRAFYTKVNDQRIWSGIDYYVPDPDVHVNGSSNQGVLKHSVVDINTEKDLITPLKKLGCSELNGSFDVRISCDAVVIGSGSGGSVAAAVLAEAGHKVLILDKGHYFAPEDLSLLEGPTAKAMYEGGAYLSTYDGGVTLMAGSTVGGGSAINWSASFRTPQHVLQEWVKEHRLAFFLSDEFFQSMDKVCQRLMVQEVVEQENFQNAVLRKGCKALNYHVGNVPRNAASDHYCGWCGLGCRSGKKMSTNETWLVDAVKAGAIILSGCEAEEILHTQKSREDQGKPMRVQGVIASATNKKRRLYIQAKTVVVACGALWTPPLLKRSGLQNPNIGKNLHIHPVTSVWGYFPDERGAPGRSYEGGIMTAYSKVAANWESSGYGPLLMVPSMHPGAFAALMPWISGEDSKKKMQRFSRTAHILCLTRDRDGGRVCADEDGRLNVNYKISLPDRESCLEGVEHALRILVAAGATEVGTQNNDGESYKVDSADSAKDKNGKFEEFVKRVRSKALRKLYTSIASAHQMGSCRMGVSPLSSALDPQGETWEVEGLFVVDTSVFPTASGVNPMVTVQSIAYYTSSQCILPYLKKRNL